MLVIAVFFIYHFDSLRSATGCKYYENDEKADSKTNCHSYEQIVLHENIPLLGSMDFYMALDRQFTENL
jgi:hypothetical protein